MQDITDNSIASCLLPFIDLCNHRGPKDTSEKDKVDFILYFKKGYADIALDKDYKAGEEYEYSYLPKSPNERLLLQYGFILKNNPQSVATVTFNLQKQFFTKKKYEACKLIECFDQNFDHFYQLSHITNTNIITQVSPHKLNEKLINAFKIYVHPNDKFIPDFATKRLKNNQWISYESELGGYSYFRENLVFQLSNAKIKFVLFYIIYLG